MFGIQTIIFEPGFYRTKALGNIKHEETSIPDHVNFNKAVIAYESSAFGHEPGDVGKGVERMIDVVKGEGMASGKEMPPRLLLGRDGLAAVREKCLETLKICEEWETLITSTDIDTQSL